MQVGSDLGKAVDQLPDIRMNVIHATQAGPVGIACINQAMVDLDVPFDKLTATLQKCYDRHFLSIWGYPVKLYNTKVAKKTDWQFIYFDDADGAGRPDFGGGRADRRRSLHPTLAG